MRLQTRTAQFGISLHPVCGGMVDKQIATGKWFVIPNYDGMPDLVGFESKSAAFDGLKRAVADWI